MAFTTLAEASAANDVIHYLTTGYNAAGTPVDHAQAVAALATLAESAYKKLGAGLNRESALELLDKHWWPASPRDNDHCSEAAADDHAPVHGLQVPQPLNGPATTWCGRTDPSLKVTCSESILMTCSDCLHMADGVTGFAGYRTPPAYGALPGHGELSISDVDQADAGAEPEPFIKATPAEVAAAYMSSKEPALRVVDRVHATTVPLPDGWGADYALSMCSLVRDGMEAFAEGTTAYVPGDRMWESIVFLESAVRHLALEANEARAERDVANAVNLVPTDPAFLADTIAELEAEFPDDDQADADDEPFEKASPAEVAAAYASSTANTATVTAILDEAGLPDATQAAVTDPLPHEVYMQAVADALADRGMSATNWWTETPDGEQLVGAFTRFANFRVAAEWPDGVHIAWDQRRGWDLISESDRSIYPLVVGRVPLSTYAHPKAVAYVAAQMLTGIFLVDPDPGLHRPWPGAEATEAAVRAWEAEGRAAEHDQADETEPIVHLPELDANGNATGHALCDNGVRNVASGELAEPNRWRANCPTCHEIDENGGADEDQADADDAPTMPADLPMECSECGRGLRPDDGSMCSDCALDAAAADPDHGDDAAPAEQPQHKPFDPEVPALLGALLSDGSCHLYAGQRVQEHLVPLDARAQAALANLLEHDADGRRNGEQLAEACARYRSERDEARVILQRIKTHLEECQRYGGRTVTVSRVLNLLSPTWPDGNYETAAEGEAVNDAEG